MKYLESSYYFDFEDEAIQPILEKFYDDALTDKEKTRGLYLLVRDGWKYDPYTISLARQNFRASVIVKKTSGNCVEKSILLVSLLRGAGIPARLHLGKVKNHLAVERLTEKFGSNELTPHGMVNVFLNGKWLKLSPAFNKELCQKFNVEPLDFDGENNSFLQQYNSEGSQFMEYTEDYGHFKDVPIAFMRRNIREHYPHIFGGDGSVTEYRL